MIRSIVRAASLGVAALGAMCVTQAASATAFTFDFTNKGTYEANFAGAASTSPYQSFSMSQGGETLNLKVTAWHANDSNPNAVTTDSISAARLGYWSGAGMGVLFGNDNGGDGTHQIDNTGGGVDFVMLQFDKDVTLSDMARNVYSMSNAGVPCCGSDAAYWADTSNFLGAPSSTANINLANYGVNEGSFKAIAGNGSFGTNASASVWLVSAAFNQNNDGFKIKNLMVNTPVPAGPVPEPATWAMMLVGFGAIGFGMRQRKASTRAIA